MTEQKLLPVAWLIDFGNGIVQATQNRELVEHARGNGRTITDLVPAAPSPDTGKISGPTGTEQLHEVIVRLRAHIDAVQAGKRGDPVVASRNPITDCINDLPAIIRLLDTAELEIEGDFERSDPSATERMRADVTAADDAPVWAEGIVTDGERVAFAQKAEADYGGTYWATDEGDGALEWEPTHFIARAALGEA